MKSYVCQKIKRYYFTICGRQHLPFLGVMNRYKKILKEVLPVFKDQEQPLCYHPYLLTKKKTGEKVCISCKRIIYIGNKLKNY